MQCTLNVPLAKLQQFQDLVKKHDLRFQGNPFLVSPEVARVTVDGEHLAGIACTEFWNEWNRLNTPIVEVTTSKWKRFMRKVKAMLPA